MKRFRSQYQINPQTTFHYSFAVVATASATRAWINRIIQRIYGKMAVIVEDIDRMDHKIDHRKRVGIIPNVAAKSVFAELIS